MSEDQPKPRGRPRKLADDGKVIHVRVGGATLKALNKEWKRRGAPSRAEIVRGILDDWVQGK